MLEDRKHVVMQLDEALFEFAPINHWIVRSCPLRFRSLSLVRFAKAQGLP